MLKFYQKKSFIIGVSVCALVFIAGVTFGYVQGNSTNSMTIIDKFKSAGLELGDVKKMDQSDYKASPRLTEDAYKFTVPSICESKDCGGRVFGFSNYQDLEKTKGYYDSLGKSSALFYSHTCNNKQYLIQINGELPKEKADKYCAVLN